MPSPDAGPPPAAPASAPLSPFLPPPLLRNADVQASLASSGFRRRRIEAAAAPLLAAAREELVECRDGARLQAWHTPPAGAGGRTVVLLHGWEGSARSVHVVSAATALWRRGFRVVRVNMRDHGDTHHLNRGIFHSCRLDEMIDAVRWVRERFPGDDLGLAGFSLGGNFALRIAAAAGPELRLRRAVAVCPVLDPAETMAALDRGPLIYRLYFLIKWRRSLERKAELFPDEYQFGSLRRFRSLTAMTDFFVTRYAGFPDLASYLQGYAVTGDRLAGLAVPSHLLLADDDPVIPPDTVARVAASPQLRIERSRFGGHCGFVQDFRLSTWLDDYLVATLS
jgi:predicted alpha/beta-fold hydrolase